MRQRTLSIYRLYKLRKFLKKKGLSPAGIRRMITAVAVPSMLGGCAHHAPTEPPQSAVGSAANKRIFYVFRGKTSNKPQSSDPAYTTNDFNQSLSDTVIIENILSRKLKQTQAEARPTPKGLPGPPTFLRSGKKPAETPTPSAVDPTLSAADTPRAAAKPTSKKLALAKLAKRKPGKSNGIADRLRERLVLTGVEHDRIAEQVTDYQHRAGAVRGLMRRAEPFLHYLLGEIERSGLPADLVFVPMVESGFETTALSPKEAAGIWQFIPSTAQQYGLTVAADYDGRYDIHASTRAALAYLKHLVGLFKGDWLLALAAYNAGEGCVQRAIAANTAAGQGTSFWDLQLPAETKAYVPKIVALSHLMANSEDQNFKPRTASSETFLARIDINREVPLANVIAASGMPPEEFFKLNPAFKPDSPPPAQNYTLLLPVDKAEPLASSIPGTRLFAERRVVVQKGDTLSILAKRLGVPKLKLAQWNGLTPNSALKAGQELIVLPT